MVCSAATSRPALSALLPFVAFVAWCAVPLGARGADDAEGKNDGTKKTRAHSEDNDTKPDGSGNAPQETKLEDTATKQVGLEFGSYTDTDHVTVFTPSIHAGLGNIGGASLNASYLVDVVSAASADIVSTASSRWNEVRQAGTVNGQFKPHDFGVGVGGSVSSEPDYLSYGAYANVVKDFDQKNWTANFGYGFSHDTAGRCGVNGACTPFTVFSRQLQRGAFSAGLAWVVDRESLASMSIDVIIENGDQSKPYRYIPMFSPQIAPTVPAGASIDFVNAHRLPERPLEQLPLSRTRMAWTGRYAHRFEESTVRIEERLYDDSWGLLASTTDAKWIFDVGNRFELWPHGRLHTQGAVSFWQRAYTSGSTYGWDLPEFRTGDRELGPLLTVEGGMGLRVYLGSDADPRSWQVGLTGDAMYTSFTDDLYLTNRTAWFGALTGEADW